jgi:hypothetical protein
MSAPTTTQAATAASAATGPLPAGAVREAPLYYDEAGRLCSASKPVPVDASGRLAGIEYVCRRDKAGGWYPINTKTVPACPLCHKRMTEVKVKPAPLLPYRQIWNATRLKLLPVGALGVELTAATAVDGAHLPAYVLAGLTPVAGVAAAKVTNRRLLKAAQRRGRVDVDAPDSDKRIREAIARQARAVGYTATAATGWLALADATGLDPHTAAGKAAYLALLAGWLLPAATWWKKTRKTPPPAVVAEPEQVKVAQTDPDEEQVRRIWTTILAAQSGKTVVGYNAHGQPVKATQNGRLAGTAIEDWYRLPGGWGATIVGPIGAYESDHFTAAIGRIASAFSVRKSMVTVMPDPEDENRAMVMVQRSSPLKGVQRWAGPESIDVTRGVAQFANYADSTSVLYELFREEWGCPHDFLCGTTGAGKSEALSMLLLIDRWAHHTDADGCRHGLVADLLIDPQQGQSYEPFMDDLAAPVAVDLAEAKLMVEAVRREMFRRNAYLSKRGWRDANGVLHRAEWVDAKGRTRYGRKWWDPRIDGPILTLNIDEAHEFLADREFVALVTAGARMYRKCGIRIRVATHTPLLTDLGGSMALRSMLTGGFVWAGRTADRLSGPTAFNGRLPADPCSLPLDPGVCFAMGGQATKPMMARTMWEPDFYDWIRDGDGSPIGYPAELPAVTWEAFGPEFAQWVQARADESEWVPESASPSSAGKVDLSSTAKDRVFTVLAGQGSTVDMDKLDELLTAKGWATPTRTIRDALKKLREAGLVFTANGRHELTPQGREQAEAGR